jgi:hypothetical protein
MNEASFPNVLTDGDWLYLCPNKFGIYLTLVNIFVSGVISLLTTEDLVDILKTIMEEVYEHRERISYLEQELGKLQLETKPKEFKDDANF